MIGMNLSRAQTIVMSYLMTREDKGLEALVSRLELNPRYQIDLVRLSTETYQVVRALGWDIDQARDILESLVASKNLVIIKSEFEPIRTYYLTRDTIAALRRILAPAPEKSLAKRSA